MNTAQVIWIATMVATLLAIVIACLIATVVRLRTQVSDLRAKREIDETKRRELKHKVHDLDICCVDILERAEKAESLARSPENALEVLRDLVAKEQDR